MTRPPNVVTALPSLLLLPLLLLSACATHLPGATAVADLAPTTGNATTGQVRFVQDGPRVHITGEVRGLKPNATHGFHVHEKGDCSSGDGMSAGGHFNPTGAPHGRHGSSAHHAGDIPSLRADASGVARFAVESGAVAVGSGATDVLGRALIVHRDPDDYVSQPNGNAGPRLACAVIRRG